MNIFYLHQDPYKSAEAMTNKHVVKMILESAQMLCTAHHMLDNGNVDQKLYKPAFVNHPSTKWVRESKKHYEWLYSHFVGLNKEYTKRYDKVHATYFRLFEVLEKFPENIPDKKFVQPPQAMPDMYKTRDSVVAYRQYYVGEKLKTYNDIERFDKILYEGEF